MNNTAPWWGRYGLAGMSLVLLAGVIVGAYLAGEKQLAGNLSMALASLASVAVGYFFTSSAGSEKKDETIAKASEALATSTPAVPSNPNPQP